MSDLRHRIDCATRVAHVARVARVNQGMGSPALLTASLAVTVVVLLGSLTGAGPGQLLVTAAAVGVLTAVLAATGHHVVQPLPARANPSGVAGAVPASTAYWCAVEAPSRPQRPRAPGRH